MTVTDPGPDVGPALHEASHAVACVVVGGRLRLTSIDAEISRADTHGFALHDPLPYRWQRAAVLWTPVITDGFGGAKADWEQLIKLPIEDVARGHVLATEIAAVHERAIVRVAAALIDEKTLTRSQVEQLIKEGTRR